MKMRAQVESLGVPAVVATANLPQNCSVKITGNETVDKAAANDFAIGELRVPVTIAATKGTVETRFRAIADVKASGTLVAGEFVKTGAPDGTTGEDTVVKFVPGTDAEERKRGICWKGGASGATVTVLLY